MYKSPIEKIYGGLQTQMVQEEEKMVIKAIEKVGVNVDKGELIKALQYDRNQYTKGYEDGRNGVLSKIRAEIAELQTYKMFEGEKTVYIACDDVLAIIDSYMAESECRNERKTDKEADLIAAKRGQ